VYVAQIRVETMPVNTNPPSHVVEYAVRVVNGTSGSLSLYESDFSVLDDQSNSHSPVDGNSFVLPSCFEGQQGTVNDYEKTLLPGADFRYPKLMCFPLELNDGAGNLTPLKLTTFVVSISGFPELDISLAPQGATTVTPTPTDTSTVGGGNGSQSIVGTWRQTMRDGQPVATDFQTCTFYADGTVNCADKGTYKIEDSTHILLTGPGGRSGVCPFNITGDVLTIDCRQAIAGAYLDVYQRVGPPGGTPPAVTPTPSLTPTATPTPSGPRGGCRPTNPPRVVVVMAMGLNSDLNLPDNYSYNPLTQDQCNVAQQKHPNLVLQQLGRTFDSYGPGSGSTSGPFLMTSLAKAGALILPFSYNYAGFADPPGRPPRFFVNGYPLQAPNEAEIIAQDWRLDNELVSIRKQWPSAKIILIGHSNGGLVIKQWWRNWDGQHGGPDHATTKWNVVGVYSLDGPINGGSSPIEVLEYTQPVGTCPDISSQLPCALLAQEFSSLWYQYALVQHDDTAMALTEKIPDRAIFTPLGTRGDVVMEMLSAGAPPYFNVDGEELGPQLLAGFDGRGQINTLLQPGRITAQNGGDVGASLGSFDSHGVVYRDSGNIAFLTQAVQAALGGRAGKLLGAPRVAYGVAGQGSIHLPAGPSAILASPAVAPGGSITVNGSGLGGQAGRLTLHSRGGITVPLTVVSWSDAQIVAGIPNGAHDGFVDGATGAGQSFAGGWLTIVGEGGAVNTLTVQVPKSQRHDGRSFRLTITAAGASGSPVADAPITISDGVASANVTTNGSGVATARIVAYGTETLVVYSGAAWTSVTVHSLPQRPRSVSLSVSDRAPKVGQPVRFTADVRGPTGRPVSGTSVAFSVIGLPGRSSKAVDVMTDKGGRATYVVTLSAPGYIAVAALIPGTVYGSGIELAWRVNDSGKSNGLSTAVGGAAIAVLILLGLVAGLWIRRRRRRSMKAKRLLAHRP
jgi:hypothetical protein